MKIMGYRCRFCLVVRDLIIGLLILLFLVTLFAIQLDNDLSTKLSYTPLTENNQLSSTSSLNTLDLALPSSYKLLQTTPTFNLDDYEELNDIILHFSGWLDYNNDSADDMIFVVEYSDTTTPYDFYLQ